MKTDVSVVTASNKITDMSGLMHLHVIPPLCYEVALEREYD